jgi:hypothetical protein
MVNPSLTVLFRFLYKLAIRPLKHVFLYLVPGYFFALLFLYYLAQHLVFYWLKSIRVRFCLHSLPLLSALFGSVRLEERAHILPVLFGKIVVMLFYYLGVLENKPYEESHLAMRPWLSSLNSSRELFD